MPKKINKKIVRKKTKSLFPSITSVNKKYIIPLVLGMVCILLLFLSMSQGVKVLPASKKVVPMTPSPTTIVPSPTLTETPTVAYPTRVPTSVPTPNVSPTPGKLGFDVGENIMVRIQRGTCAEAFNVTPIADSTSFHLDGYLFHGVNWQQSSFTIQNKESAKVFLCSDFSTSCGDGGGAESTLHDDTTGAVEKFWVNFRITC